MKEPQCYCQLGALSNLLNEEPDKSGMAVGKKDLKAAAVVIWSSIVWFLSATKVYFSFIVHWLSLTQMIKVFDQQSNIF